MPHYLVSLEGSPVQSFHMDSAEDARRQVLVQVDLDGATVEAHEVEFSCFVTWDLNSIQARQAADEDEDEDEDQLDHDLLLLLRSLPAKYGIWLPLFVDEEDRLFPYAEAIGLRFSATLPYRSTLIDRP
ncbi:hypothetical protein L6R46_05975 [Myxococcota bacterium]|jgi:hypothetical protein|nr:hypothetical protein [Myxococcota bacterium]